MYKKFLKISLLTMAISSFATLSYGSSIFSNPPLNKAVLKQGNSKLEKVARAKITQLETLMHTASKKHLGIEREKATIWFAKNFLTFANYDEAHIPYHIKLFSAYPVYKDDAEKLGKGLPTFERNDVIKMLDVAINTLKGVISGKIVRKPVNEVDWKNIKVKDGEFYNGSNGRPVFLYDYFSKTRGGDDNDIGIYNDYLGAITRPPYIGLDMLKNAQGDLVHDKDLESLVKPFSGKDYKPLHSVESVMNYDKLFPNLKDNIGTMVLWHGGSVLPQWAIDKYGKDNLMHMSFNYSIYDTNSPYIRKMWTQLFDQLIPRLKGKNFTKMGYRLANEPHWYVDTNGWGAVKNGIGKYTLAKFQTWLKHQHNDNIQELNVLWNTSYKSFDDVKFEVPFVLNDYINTAVLYDWSRFSMANFTDWFQFLHDGIKRNDPNAHTNIKISSTFTNISSVRSNGVDPEGFTNVTDFIGNDVKIRKDDAYDETRNVYKKKYAYYWRDVGMSYELYNSFGPDKINVNTEAHFITGSRHRDLFMTPQYVRSTYWLATILGMNGNLTWYWARNSDGSLEPHTMSRDPAKNSSFAASCSEMPRVSHEYLQTMLDLNANSEDITLFQHTAMPIRVFYSETTSINRQPHIDETYHMFENVFFDGLPIGFATKKILNDSINTHLAKNAQFDNVVIYKTTNATPKEFQAVQDYLNHGGTVIIDNASFTLDEYNRPLGKTLTQGKGKLIVVASGSLSDMEKAAIKEVKPSHIPSIQLTESSKSTNKGIVWREETRKDGTKILTAINLGKYTADVTLSSAKKHTLHIKDILTGERRSSKLKLPSEGVLFLEIK